MRRLIPVWVALVVALLFPAIAAAQNARVFGQVMDRDGKPWAGVSIEIKSQNGQTYSLKTDKNGKYSQIGLAVGVYTFVLSDTAAGLTNFSEQHQIQAGEDNEVNFNFKQIISQQATANPDEEKKRQAQQSQFNNMKGHVDAGVAAFNDINQVQAQLKTTPPDQQGPLKDKLKTDYQTAITEFQAAEPLAGEKDTKNHAIILANLGQAYSLAGQNDQAADAYQKSVALNPQAATYVNLSLAQAHQAATLTDPTAATAKVGEAGTSCDKAAALDPTTTSKCWKNIGIVLNNKGDFKDAVDPLTKATQADPKDAQGWYLLGSTYTGLIQPKQEGDKMTFVIPPGTVDAYQKCIDADPNGPWAAQAKQNLDALAAMGSGEATKVLERTPSKKKK